MTTASILASIKTHLAYPLVIGLLILGAHSWLTEHDARLKAETALQSNQAQVSQLVGQIKTLAASTQARVLAATQAQAKITTPALAIAAIPSLETLPLHSRPSPVSPMAVSVDAMPLAQTLTQLRVATVQLSGCQDTLQLQQQIDAQKDAAILTLKKKPSFWSRVGSTAKTVAIGMVIGFVGSRL